MLFTPLRFLVKPLKDIDSMKADFEKIYHQLESKHFWFQARRKYILQELKKADRGSIILDIGCSSGLLLDELALLGFKKDNLYGIDISKRAIGNCKSLGIENTFLMDAQNITLNQKFDIIIASDCLEHLKDDEKALNNWNSLLRQNGLAYIFVPAFSSLWSKHDEVNMHYRRYTKKELTDKLIRNGFEIKKSSYWNFFLFMPILLIRFFSKFNKSLGKNSGDLNKIPLFNIFFFFLLNFENKMLEYISFPVGVSTYCISKKTSSSSM